MEMLLRVGNTEIEVMDGVDGHLFFEQKTDQGEESAFCELNELDPETQEGVADIIRKAEHDVRVFLITHKLAIAEVAEAYEFKTKDKTFAFNRSGQRPQV